MNTKRPYYFFLFFFILPLLLVQNTGCYKDYSFEGIDSARVQKDSVNPAPVAIVREFPECSYCSSENTLSVGQWSFNAGNSYLCGSTTNSGFFSGYTKMDFTFFGPSACSVDTGLVVSAYMAVPLDQDLFNITSSSAAFYYYDHHAPKDIFIGLPPEPFSVTVDSYIYQTGIVTGSFKGTVYKANGDTALITGGRFKVKLK